MSAATAITTEDPRDCWRTQRELFEGLHKRHRFEVDAAADDDNHLLANYWTPVDDGVSMLGRSLARAWVNPPYSELARWVGACSWRAEVSGAFSALLVPANRTQMAWFHDYAMAAEWWFFRGRVPFDPPPGVAASSPRHNSMLLVFDTMTLGSGVRGSLCPRTGVIL